MTLEMWRALRFYAKAAMLIYQDRTGEKVRKLPKHLRVAVVSTRDSGVRAERRNMTRNQRRRSLQEHRRKMRWFKRNHGWLKHFISNRFNWDRIWAEYEFDRLAGDA